MITYSEPTSTRGKYRRAPKTPVPTIFWVARCRRLLRTDRCGRRRTDEQGRILLQRRRDNDLWALPGGGMEMTDSLPGTAVREVKEETGLDVEITGLVGTYTDPRHVIACTDGEVRREFNVCVTARVSGGQLEISHESTEPS
ncbi:hypothetical protein GCM10010381_63930 [Streptomyces xantholiticus]|nr:hypothetical protein GCM10010381_63930 [Streptomyces xantholiticus]